MLVISFKQHNQTHQVKIPPIFLELNETLLNYEIEQVIAQVYLEFKHYLSPFVTPEHIRLQLASHQILLRKTPLYLYINYKQYIQPIFCSIGSIEQIKEENAVANNQKHTLVLRVSSQSDFGKGKSKLLFTKQKSCQDLNFNEIIQPQDRVIIRGRQIMTDADIRQAKWFLSHWSNYESKGNQCLYVCIDRPAEIQS